MAKLINLADRRKIKALIYGNPGSGKTRLACSAALVPELSPVLYLHASGNPESIADYDSYPDMIEVEELTDVNAPYHFLASGQPKDHPFRRQFDLQHWEGNNPYKTVIVDQVSDIQQIAFRKLLRVGQPETRLPGTFFNKREWEHYNKVLYQNIEFADLFYGLPIHVIMCAWEQTVDRDKYPGEVNVLPMLEGKGVKAVPGKANLVGRIQGVQSINISLLEAVNKDLDRRGYQEAEWNVVFWRSNRTYLAKNQLSQKLGSYMADPTMEEIWDLLN